MDNLKDLIPEMKSQIGRLAILMEGTTDDDYVIVHSAGDCAVGKRDGNYMFDIHPRVEALLLDQLEAERVKGFLTHAATGFRLAKLRVTTAREYYSRRIASYHDTIAAINKHEEEEAA